MKEKIIASSGNVFEDLGFEEAEASILAMRSALMNDLRQYIEKNTLTQTEAAEKLGISQARTSDLVRGKWEKFNLEFLITLEARLGRKISLRLAA
jgi:predicted XRE-type DNA-binding protein